MKRKVWFSLLILIAAIVVPGCVSSFYSNLGYTELTRDYAPRFIALDDTLVIQLNPSKPILPIYEIDFVVHDGSLVLGGHRSSGRGQRKKEFSVSIPSTLGSNWINQVYWISDVANQDPALPTFKKAKVKVISMPQKDSQ